MTTHRAEEIAKDMADWFLPDGGNTTETPNTLLRVEIAKALTEYGDACVLEWRETNKKGWATWYIGRLEKEVGKARNLALEEAAKVLSNLDPKGDVETDWVIYREQAVKKVRALKSGEAKRV